MIPYITKRNRVQNKIVRLMKSARIREMKAQKLEKEKEAIDSELLVKESSNYFIDLGSLLTTLPNSGLKIVDSENTELTPMKLFQLLLETRQLKHLVEIQKSKHYDIKDNSVSATACSDDSHIHLCTNTKPCPRGLEACTGQSILFISIKK